MSLEKKEALAIMRLLCAKDFAQLIQLCSPDQVGVSHFIDEIGVLRSEMTHNPPAKKW